MDKHFTLIRNVRRNLIEVVVPFFFPSVVCAGEEARAAPRAEICSNKEAFLFEELPFIHDVQTSPVICTSLGHMKYNPHLLIILSIFQLSVINLNGKCYFFIINIT